MEAKGRDVAGSGQFPDETNAAASLDRVDRRQDADEPTSIIPRPSAPKR